QETQADDLEHAGPLQPLSEAGVAEVEWIQARRGGSVAAYRLAVASKHDVQRLRHPRRHALPFHGPAAIGRLSNLQFTCFRRIAQAGVCATLADNSQCDGATGCRQTFSASPSQTHADGDLAVVDLHVPLEGWVVLHQSG